MYENKYKKNTINVHRSAIASVLPLLDGAPIGQNFLVSKLMKGIYSKLPPQPRYQSIWDLDKRFKFHWFLRLRWQSIFETSIQEISLSSGCHCAKKSIRKFTIEHKIHEIHTELRCVRITRVIKNSKKKRESPNKLFMAKTTKITNFVWYMYTVWNLIYHAQSPREMTLIMEVFLSWFVNLFAPFPLRLFHIGLGT